MDSPKHLLPLLPAIPTCCVTCLQPLSHSALGEVSFLLSFKAPPFFALRMRALHVCPVPFSQEQYPALDSTCPLPDLRLLQSHSCLSTSLFPKRCPNAQDWGRWCRRPLTLLIRNYCTPPASPSLLAPPGYKVHLCGLWEKGKGKQRILRTEKYPLDPHLPQRSQFLPLPTHFLHVGGLPGSPPIHTHLLVWGL